MSPTIRACFRPWIEVMSREPDASLQGRVRQHGTDYLDQWTRELELPSVPALQNVLDHREPLLTQKRVLAMLRGIQKYLTECTQAELVPLHALIRFKGNIAASPLLLSAAATVYSQTDWNQRQFHDLHSAHRTETLLDGMGFPQKIVDDITLLVGLKNIVRTAVGRDKEVGVWDSEQLSFRDDDIARCFAALLNACWPGQTECMCEALMLVALAYEARFMAPKISPSEFQTFLGKVKQAMNPMPPSAGDVPHHSLVHIELSKYAFPLFADRQARARDIMSYLSEAQWDPKPFMLWLSMDRYWSTIHPTRLAGLRDLPRYFCKGDLERRPRSFVGLLDSRRTLLYGLELAPDKAFTMIFGSLANTPEPTIWDRVDKALESFRQHRGDDSPIPTAFVSRVLQILGHCYPDEMFELRIGRTDDHPAMGTSTSLWLPRETPKIDYLEAAVKNGIWADPQLLVVRCAASTVMNRCISYGYLVRVLDSDLPVATLKAWTELINWGAAKNAHEALVEYLKKVLAPPPDTLYPAPKQRPVKAISDPLILGVDIGGTSVRAACYDYDAQTEQLGERVREMDPFPTRSMSQYENAAAFVTRIKDELAREWGQDWTAYHQRVVAIGVTWPGAVVHHSGLGFVAANSGTLAYFKPYPEKAIWNATADEIRRFGLREAFEECFEANGVCPHIKLINDADAHVLHETWQLKEFTLSPGEIAVGLTAGTGSGWAILDGDTGYTVDVLAEVGRLITHISVPYPGEERFPVGTGRDAFNKDTLGKAAYRLLKRASSGREGLSNLPLVPSLLIGWIIESQHTNNPVVTKDEFETRWQRERPRGETRSLSDLRVDLVSFLERLSRKEWENDKGFAAEVVKWAGYELADLVATTTGIFKAVSCITGGGPLSGWIGHNLRMHAREELKSTYSFDVVEDQTSAIGIRLPSLIRFPEPHLQDAPPGSAGAHGAALAAAESLRSTQLAQTRTSSIELQVRPSLPQPIGVSFSAFSVLELGKDSPGYVLFPGREHMPKHTLGYIRSCARAQIASDLGSPRYSVGTDLPWRDYDDDALTPADDLVPVPYKHHGVIISARNTLNEWGYQLRFNGQWWRRYDDPEIDPAWPVIQCSRDGVRLVRLAAARSDADLITGIPLAIEDVPSSREFLVACCSDVAHVFDVDPRGRRGPSAEAWRELSGLWQELKDKSQSDSEIAMQMEQLAKCLNVAPSHHLLHSILAQRANGSLVALAITGALTDIANELVRRWEVRHAVLLDNGGSVGWQALVRGAKAPVILVSGPNYRPQGTVFLVLETDGFLHPQSHSALSR